MTVFNIDNVMVSGDAYIKTTAAELVILKQQNAQLQTFRGLCSTAINLAWRNPYTTLAIVGVGLIAAAFTAYYIKQAAKQNDRLKNKLEEKEKKYQNIRGSNKKLREKIEDQKKQAKENLQEKERALETTKSELTHLREETELNATAKSALEDQHQKEIEELKKLLQENYRIALAELQEAEDNLYLESATRVRVVRTSEKEKQDLQKQNGEALAELREEIRRNAETKKGLEEQLRQREEVLEEKSEELTQLKATKEEAERKVGLELQQKEQQLQKAQEELQAQKEEAERAKEGLQGDIKRLQDEKAALEKELREEIKAQKQQAKENLQEKERALQEKERELREEIGHNATAKSALEDQLQQAAQENQGLQEQLKQKLDVANSPNTLNVRQVDNSELGKQNSDLKKTIISNNLLIQDLQVLVNKTLKIIYLKEENVAQKLIAITELFSSKGNMYQNTSLLHDQVDCMEEVPLNDDDDKFITQELENTKRALQEKENEINTLQQANQGFQEQFQKAQEELQEKERELSQLTEQLQELQSQKKQAEESLQEKERELREKIWHNATAKSALEDQHQKEIEELKKLLQEDYRIALAELKAQKEETERAKEGLQGDIKRLQAEKAALEKLREQLQQREKELRKELQEKETQLKDTKEEAERKVGLELQQTQNELETSKNQLSQLQEQLRGEIERNKIQTEDLMSKLTQLTEQLQQRENELQKELQQKEEQLQKAQEELQAQKEEAERAKEGLQGDIKRLQAEKATSEKNLREKEQQLQRAQAELQNEKATLEKLREELQQTQNELETSKNQLSQLTEQHQEKERELREETERNKIQTADLMSKLTQLTEQLQQREKELRKELQQKEEQLQKAQEELQEEITQLQEELEQLKLENDQIKARGLRLKNDREANINNLQDKKAALEKTKRELQEKIQQREEVLKKQSDELEQLRKDHTSTIEEKELLDNTNDTFSPVKTVTLNRGFTTFSSSSHDSDWESMSNSDTESDSHTEAKSLFEHDNDELDDNEEQDRDPPIITDRKTRYNLKKRENFTPKKINSTSNLVETTENPEQPQIFESPNRLIRDVGSTKSATEGRPIKKPIVLSTSLSVKLLAKYASSNFKYRSDNKTLLDDSFKLLLSNFCLKHKINELQKELKRVNNLKSDLNPSVTSKQEEEKPLEVLGNPNVKSVVPIIDTLLNEKKSSPAGGNKRPFNNEPPSKRKPVTRVYSTRQKNLITGLGDRGNTIISPSFNLARKLTMKEEYTSATTNLKAATKIIEKQTMPNSLVVKGMISVFYDMKRNFVEEQGSDNKIERYFAFCWAKAVNAIFKNYTPYTPGSHNKINPAEKCLDIFKNQLKNQKIYCGIRTNNDYFSTYTEEIAPHDVIDIMKKNQTNPISVLLKALKNKSIEIQKETTKATNKCPLSAQPTDNEVWSNNTHIKKSRELRHDVKKSTWTQRVASRDIPNYKIGIM